MDPLIAKMLDQDDPRMAPIKEVLDDSGLIEKITREKDLGNSSLSGLKPYIEASFAILRFAFDNRSKSVPDDSVNQLTSLAEWLKGLAVSHADIEKGNGYYEARTNTEQNLIHDFQRRLSEAKNYLSSFRISRIESQLGVLEDAPEKLKEIVTDAKGKLGEIDESRIAAEGIIGNVRSKILLWLSDSMENKILNINTILAIVFLIGTCVFLFSAGNQSQVAVEEVDQAFKESLALGKDLPVSLIFVHGIKPFTLAIIAAVCLRIAFASWHNVLIATHRKFVANSINRIKETVQTPEGQDMVVCQIVNALIVHQSTGFSKSPVDSGILPSPFRELSKATDDH